MARSSLTKTKHFAPDILHHLVEFSPVETRILSFDNKMQPWSFMLERYPLASLVGSLYVGVVTALYKPACFALLDIGDKNPVFVQFRKNQPLPHIGQKLLVQCKREGFAAKAPLMSEVQIHKKRYVILKIIPKRLSPPQTNSLQYADPYPLLTEILSACMEKTAFSYHLDGYHLQWSFTSFATKFSAKFPESTQQKELFSLALSQEVEQLYRDILAPIRSFPSKKKGRVTPYTEKMEDKLLRLIKPNDSLVLKDFGTAPNLYREKIANYPDILQKGPPTSLHPVTSIDTSESIHTILQHRHFFSKSAAIEIHETPTLTAIDVDTGIESDATILDINFLALPSILRLICVRNLSGLILIDPVSSPKKGQSRVLVEKLRQWIKLQHPLLSQCRIDVLGTSPSGLLELTRERQNSVVSHHYVRKYRPDGTDAESNQHLVAQVADMLHNLSKKATTDPKAMLAHQPVLLSTALYGVLKKNYAPIMREFEQKWQDIPLWKINDS